RAPETTAMPHRENEHVDRDSARDVLDVRDAVRAARQARVEQARVARERAREQARVARESLKETIRQAREAHRDAVRDVRDGRRGTAPDEPDTRTRIQQVAIELFEWAKDKPRNAATRSELLRRYSEMLQQRGHDRLMRFFERNQSSMNQHK